MKEMVEKFRAAWAPHLRHGGPAPDSLVARLMAELERDAEAAAGLPKHDGEGSPFDILGKYSAFIVVDWIDADAAAACLADKMELDPPDGTPEGKHPVMYSFGFHSLVHPRFFHLWHYDYGEALVGLPGIRMKGQPQVPEPCFCMTAVRLNNLLADEIGVVMGLPKEMAKIHAHTDGDRQDYAVWMRGDSAPIMHGTFERSGDHFSADHPNFVEIRRMVLQQPVISHAAAGNYMLTPFHVNTESAKMYPARAKFTVSGNGLPGLPDGEYNLPGFDTAPFGSCYHSVHDWTMSPPVPIP